MNRSRPPRSCWTTASVRERIYARVPGHGAEPMAGVLIYTAAPDSEGTLGGLVSLEAPGRHIDEALEQVRLCASDPLCAEHQPLVALTVHGARGSMAISLAHPEYLRLPQSSLS